MAFWPWPSICSMARMWSPIMNMCELMLCAALPAHVALLALAEPGAQCVCRALLSHRCHEINDCAGICQIISLDRYMMRCKGVIS